MYLTHIIIEMPYMHVHHITCVRGRKGQEKAERGGRDEGQKAREEREGEREERENKRVGEEGRKAGTGAYSYNFVSFVSSSTRANASSSKNCVHMARRLLA